MNWQVNGETDTKTNRRRWGLRTRDGATPARGTPADQGGGPAARGRARRTPGGPCAVAPARGDDPRVRLVRRADAPCVENDGERSSRALGMGHDAATASTRARVHGAPTAAAKPPSRAAGSRDHHVLAPSPRVPACQPMPGWRQATGTNAGRGSGRSARALLTQGATNQRTTASRHEEKVAWQRLAGRSKRLCGCLQERFQNFPKYPALQKPWQVRRGTWRCDQKPSERQPPPWNDSRAVPSRVFTGSHVIPDPTRR